jgi:CRP-like cAMP-binding protein
LFFGCETLSVSAGDHIIESGEKSGTFATLLSEKNVSENVNISRLVLHYRMGYSGCLQRKTNDTRVCIEIPLPSFLSLVLFFLIFLSFSNLLVTLQSGDIFGESALRRARHIPRSATVVARTDCVLLYIDSHMFKSIISREGGSYESHIEDDLARMARMRPFVKEVRQKPFTEVT